MPMTAQPTNNDDNKLIVDHFVEALFDDNPIFAKSVVNVRKHSPELFLECAVPLLTWAKMALGESYPRRLIDGYKFFVSEVNRAQDEYETAGSYKYSRYEDVSKNTYGSKEFMDLYHWGVYTTTFAWQHHLRIFDYYCREFLPLFSDNKNGLLIDYGFGSGVWSLIGLSRLTAWNAIGVDISSTSVDYANHLAIAASANSRTQFVERDALVFQPECAADAGISCFLLEHLENPGKLLDNLSSAVKVGAPVFVTLAITAAEIDHIYEFRRESEAVTLAEDAGFRILSTLSSAPSRMDVRKKYLPRSMAMILERRRGMWW